MAIQKYSKFGLRRDNNLGDLSNSTQALNNILDTLVDNEQSSFVSEDLDAIRNIFASGLTNDQYKSLVDSSIEFSDSNGVVRTVSPNFTYQNRLDKFRTFSGEPRINGGNGLTARYYNFDQVFENSVGIFSGTPFRVDNYWEAGNFNYNQKITPEASTVNGGIEWEGFFIPETTGARTFSINSSAGFTFDFQTAGYTSGIGTYTEISRIGITTTFSGSGTINTNTITLSTPSNTKFVAIGQSVSASGIVSESTVSDFNRSTGVITLSPPSGISNAVSSSFSGNITFSKSIGQPTNISYGTYNLEQYQRYRIRIRYFIPQAIDAGEVSRYINIQISNLSGNGRLRYNNLYDLNYDFSENAKGEFIKYLDSSVNFGGGTVGGTTNSDNYVKVKTSKKIDISYQPKTTISAIIKSTTSATTTSGLTVISVPNTSGIEIGNYVFGTGIVENAIVNDIQTNGAVILNIPATASATSTLTFVDHRGFVKRAIGGGSGGSFTLSSGNTSNLKSGVQAYTRITTSSSTSTITISPTQTIATETTVYFYESKGLVNNSLTDFCLPTQTKCVIVTANTPIGSTTIPVNDSTGIGNGWSVQGLQFAPNTFVDGSPPSPTSIIINAGTIRNLTVGSNFTVTNATGDRQLCCPPTDTSPPFNSTLDGLETVSASPNLRIESGNVVFSELTAVVSPAEITQFNANTDTSRSRISLQTPKGVFTILCQ